MRFPKTEVMQPVFDLFDKIGLKTGEYLFKDRHSNSAMLFNDIQRRRTEDPVTPQKFEITGVPAEPYGNLGWAKNVANVVDPFADRLIHDFTTNGKRGWEIMMEYDQYSMRSYMAGNRSDKDRYDDLDRLNLMPYPLEVVNWCETFDKSSGWYDRALSETVLEALAFSWDGKPIDWKYIVCVPSGTVSIYAHAHRMLAAVLPSWLSPWTNTCPSSRATRGHSSTLASSA